MSAKTVATTRSAMNIPTGRLGVWWLLVSEIVIFGGLLVAYIMNRQAHSHDWAAQAAVTDWRIGAFNTFVLLSSSLSAVFAHQAAEKGDGKKAARLLYVTCLGGLIFLLVKSFEWATEISHGYTIMSHTFWSYYYTLAGLHAFHVIAGMAVMVWVARTAAKNQELHRVENVGIYWHFVDIVWIFLFPLLYIAK